MKVRLFALAALVLGLASCQTDFEGVSTNTGNEVDFQLAVATPELGATRADKDGRNGHDSAYGAIDYLTEEDWKSVDLRYSLEVYDFNEEGYDGATPVKDRLVQIVDKYEPVTFDLRLVPNRRYHFVVFADFVPQDSWNNNELSESVADQAELGLRHIIGNNLGQITLTKDAINDEYTDAYFATKDLTIANSSAQDIELTRPYGKVRVIATDLAELNLNVDPKSVKVTYDAYHANAFNAVTGEISGEYKPAIYNYTYNDGVCKNSLANHYYTEGYDNFNPYGITNDNGEKRHTHMTLFTDYILATDTQTPIHFKMEVFDQQGLIKETHFITEIPVQRNHLTTIIGNVLTTATEINVTIDDNFENQDRQYYVFEAFANVEGYKAGVNDGIVTLDRNYVIGNPIYVRSGINAVLNLNGFTIENAAKNGYTDVIIVENGATLTINGEGTIKAVDGNDGYAVIADGEVTINGGIYEAGVDANGEANAVIYTRGTDGKVFINGGYFPNKAKSSFVLNKRDADRATTTIEVRGGTFEYFDPMNNTAEGTGTNFVASGFASTLEGEHTYVVRESQDYTYDETTNTYYVYNANGLATWAYVAANTTTSPNLEVMNNIKLPKKTIEPDDANKRYTFTGEDITVTDGIPSGSNWPAISDYETSKNPETGIYEYYGGVINGNGYTISGLRINHDLVASGFLCWTKGAKVDELTFDDAVVYNKGGNLGETYTGIIIGRCWDGSHVNDCHIKNSSVLGKKEVGGLVGRVYRRTVKTNTPDGQPQSLMEKIAYVTYCTTDNKTVVKGETIVGGIVGMNYGAVVGQCVNNADVFANDIAGGVAGYTRSYTVKSDGYIIACKSSADATITSDAYAGGIVGQVFQDTKHYYTRSWVVGCVSESKIVAAKPATMIGYSSSATVTACWAVKNGANVIAAYGTPINEASFQYTAATDATQADIDAMNLAIEAFNNSPDNISIDGTVGAVMLKRWALVNGVPVLQ